MPDSKGRNPCKTFKIAVAETREAERGMKRDEAFDVASDCGLRADSKARATLEKDIIRKRPDEHRLRAWR